MSSVIKSEPNGVTSTQRELFPCVSDTFPERVLAEIKKLTNELQDDLDRQKKEIFNKFEEKIQFVLQRLSKVQAEYYPEKKAHVSTNTDEKEAPKTPDVPIANNQNPDTSTSGNHNKAKKRPRVSPERPESSKRIRGNPEGKKPPKSGVNKTVTGMGDRS